MIRFVDVRGQGLQYRFSFWSTSSDSFRQFDGQQAWDTFDEFKEAYNGDELERYKSLCPEWVFSYCESDKREVISITSVKELILAAAKTEDHVGGLVVMLIEELEALETN